MIKVPAVYFYIIILLILSGVVANIFFNKEGRPKDQKHPSYSQVLHNKKETPALKYLKPLVFQPQTNTVKLSNSRLPKDESHEKQTHVFESMELVYSADDNERVGGVEQLVAYPSLESEIILSKLLLTDLNAEVRNAAALSLVSINNPLDTTIYDLISALEDESKDVRFSALSTLQDYMLRQVTHLDYTKIILSELTYKIENTAIATDTRDAINQLLKEK